MRLNESVNRLAPALNCNKHYETIAMPLILLLLAAMCLAVTFMTNVPFGITVVLVFASLGFVVAAVLSFMSARLQSNRRDDSKMISPEELRLMREQAAARKAAENADPNRTQS